VKIEEYETELKKERMMLREEDNLIHYAIGKFLKLMNHINRMELETL